VPWRNKLRKLEKFAEEMGLPLKRRGITPLLSEIWKLE
jgi:hypothetical protein